MDLHVDSISSSGPKFTVTMVANTGSYAKQWWWWYGLSDLDLSQKLQQLNARLISISPYQNGNDLRFAAVMVASTGADAKQWWWFFGDGTIVGNALKPLNARVVDLEPYTFKGQKNYAAIAIANQGADTASWWWWFNISASQLGTQLNTTPTQILTLCNDANGFDVTMQAPPTAEWWYYYGINARAVGDNLSQNGARLTQARSYPGPIFDVVMINNSDAFTTRIGNILRSNGAGWYGFYLKQVNGPVIGALNEHRAFDAASCIKIVFALYAMQQVQIGSAKLSDWMPLLFLDNPRYCVNTQMSLGTGDGSTKMFTGSVILSTNNTAPILKGSIRVTAGSVKATDNGAGALVGSKVSGNIDYTSGNISVTFQQAPATGVQVLVEESLQAAITKMMQNSDNARCDMLMNRYGLATLFNFAHSIGMPDTQVNYYVACQDFNPSGLPNYLTLADAAHLYEGLANATLLSAANVQVLSSMMAGKNYDSSGIWAALQKIVQQEATPFGLSSMQLASFISAIRISEKAGSGGFPNGNTSIDGNTVYSIAGNIGWVEIPSCNGNAQISTQYVFGFLGESTAQNTTTWNAMGAGAEILRETIRAALATWSQCARSGIFDAKGQSGPKLNASGTGIRKVKQRIAKSRTGIRRAARSGRLTGRSNE